MNKDKVERITRKVIDECNVYPKPDKEDVCQKVKEANTVFESESSSVSESRIVDQLSTSFELKIRISDDSWIIYKSELVDIKR